MAAKTGGFRGKIKTTSRGPAPGQRPNVRPSTQPRIQGPWMVRPNWCGNCDGEHAARDCNQPLLDPDQRACFNCGGLGHLSRDCKEKKKPPQGRQPPSRSVGGRPAHLVEHDGEDVIHALMVTVDADGYQEVRPRNGAPATLSNFRAQRAGLSQGERKAGPRLQNMFDLLGGSYSISADISHTIRTDCNSMRYISASAASPGTGASSSSTAPSSTSRPSGLPAHLHNNNMTLYTSWPAPGSTSHGGW